MLRPVRYEDQEAADHGEAAEQAARPTPVQDQPGMGGVVYAVSGVLLTVFEYFAMVLSQ